MIPTVDFSNLTPGSANWDDARRQVMESLETYGCVEAIDDRITPELRAELFGPAMDSVFALPLEKKMAISSGNPRNPNRGYIGGIQGLDYESVPIPEANTKDGAERFTQHMWPEGNPTFCERVWTFAGVMEDLEKKVRQMVLQSLGVNKYYDSDVAMSTYNLRFSCYGGPADHDSKVAFRAHKDPNILTLICQGDAGLEVQVKDEEFISVLPSPNSVNIMVGEAFEAWTNRRLKAPYHRVRMESNHSKRYSTVFGARPREGYIVRTPDELVDEKHPRIYKAFDYNDYLLFRFSEEGKQSKESLLAFAELVQEKIVV